MSGDAAKMIQLAYALNYYPMPSGTQRFAVLISRSPEEGGDLNENAFVIDKSTGEWCDFGQNHKRMYGLESFAKRLTGCSDKSELSEIIRKLLAERGYRDIGNGLEPTIIKMEPSKIQLTDFMKALGQEHPVAADGDLRIYNSPYDSTAKGTMVINIQTNLWRDTKSGANGGIYDLAYELTGCANKSELNRYIAGEMNAYEKQKSQSENSDKSQSPKKMRL